MMPSETVDATTVLSAGTSAATLDALFDALQSERRLVLELIELMRRQRAAVAADDLEAVEETVYATHRVLHTLNEARRRRRTLKRMLGEDETPGIAGLDSLLGDRMSEPMRQARDELQAAALTLSREVATNRQVLREAIATGDEYVRALCGAPEVPVGYPKDASRGSTERAGGVLFDRMA